MLQLEVLELLVQNGADLNAKNKHDETPAGIDCRFVLICVTYILFNFFSHLNNMKYMRYRYM